MSLLSPRREKYVALGLIVMFVSLSLATIARFSPWHDESYTATLIQGSYADIIHRTAWDVHPPFYYLVLKTWSALFGSSVVALRSFSLVCMTIAIVIAWRLMRRWYGWQNGLCALAGMSTGAFLVRYSQEMRMYGMGAMLAMASTYVFWRLYHDKLRRRHVWLLTAAYVLLITVAVYTHYFLGFLPIAHLLFVLFDSRQSLFKTVRHLPARWWVGFGAPLLFFVPWLPIAMDQFHKTHNVFWIKPVTVDTLTSTIINTFLFRQQSELSGRSAVFGVAVLVSIVTLLVAWYRASEASLSAQQAKRLSAYLLVIPLILLVLVSLPPFSPAYQDRYLSFYAPILYGSFAIGLIQWLRASRHFVEWLLAAVAIGSIGASLVFVSVLGNNQGWQPYPMFTIYKLDNFIKQTNPHANIVSTTLWTFFDAHVTVGRTIDTKLYVPAGTEGKYGNWSAIYNRPELMVSDLNTEPGPNIWILEESGLVPPKLPGNWSEVTRYQAGYARVVLYHINK